MGQGHGPRGAATGDGQQRERPIRWTDAVPLRGGCSSPATPFERACAAFMRQVCAQHRIPYTRRLELLSIAMRLGGV
jgi:hypothetical protein